MNSKYLIDFGALLTEEERLAWQTIREFGERRIAPHIAAHYEAGTFPRELIAEFGELGLLGGSLVGYGDAHMSAVAYGLSMLELERQDSAMRSFCSVQSALVMWPIHAFGDEQQKARWLPSLAKGKSIGAFGLTEPNSGSDPSSMQTRAVLQGSEYVISGHKQWITNSPIADVFVVWAQTTDTGADSPMIRGFVLERGMAGLSTPKLDGKLSLRASCTGEIVMDDVRVPASNLLPGARGLKGPLSCLSQARYGIGWGALGAAMAVYECALDYCSTRKQFNKPIASFQLSQQKLVAMHNEICKGFLLALHLGQQKDAGRLTPTQISFLKRDNVAIALDAARSARSMLGANGISGEYPVMRHLCNLESVYTYEGTHEVHTLAIGRALTGISAFD